MLLSPFVSFQSRFVTYLLTYPHILHTKYLILMDAIPLCDVIKAYTGIYVNTQQFLSNTTLFCAWRHVSAAHLQASLQ